MPPMPITDSMFLLVETREHPVHVGGLQLYDLPEGAGPDYLGELHRRLITGTDEVDAKFRRRPQRSIGTLGQWGWTTDGQVDLEYHVRLSALPRPGRIRELLELVGRLHGSLLDRHRPLWEFHLIEGVEDRRFAVYTKVHHAVNDGVSALALLRRALSEDPTARDMRPMWALGDRPPRGNAGVGRLLAQLACSPVRTAGTVARTVGDALGIGPAALNAVRAGIADSSVALPLQAPRSMLNVPITGARRFAAQSWSLERIRAVCGATGATVNDVVLGMCAGALRAYLLEHDALPDRPLIAMVPVSLRAARDADDGAADQGNAFGVILCNLGTDLADPAERFTRLRSSMDRGKRAYEGRSTLQITALSAAMAAPLLTPMLPGGTRFAPPPFNLIISNIPGPPRRLYWEGAPLRGLYPLSVPIEGQALNITVTTYAANLEFGLTGCRSSVPHLQRLLTHLEDALVHLETAAAVGRAP